MSFETDFVQEKVDTARKKFFTLANWSRTVCCHFFEPFLRESSQNVRKSQKYNEQIVLRVDKIFSAGNFLRLWKLMQHFDFKRNAQNCGKNLTKRCKCWYNWSILKCNTWHFVEKKETRGGCLTLCSEIQLLYKNEAWRTSSKHHSKIVWVLAIPMEVSLKTRVEARLIEVFMKNCYL